MRDPPLSSKGLNGTLFGAAAATASPLRRNPQVARNHGLRIFADFIYARISRNVSGLARSLLLSVRRHAGRREGLGDDAAGRFGAATSIAKEDAASDRDGKEAGDQNWQRKWLLGRRQDCRLNGRRRFCRRRFGLGDYCGGVACRGGSAGLFLFGFGRRF